MRMVIILISISLLSCKQTVESKKSTTFNEVPEVAPTPTDQENRVEPQSPLFDNLYNQKLIGLSVVDESSSNPFKKYGLDFTAACYCDRPSLYIDKTKNEVMAFNYCESDSPINDIESVHHFPILNISSDETKLIITTQSDLKFIIQWLDKDADIYSIKIEGKLPKEYIGQQISTLFTTHPEHFVPYNCDGFEG